MEVPTYKTLVLVIKNGKCIHSELKNKNYFNDYYKQNPEFYNTVNLLLKQCDEVWFINFDKFDINKLTAIKCNSEGIDFISTVGGIEFYNVLKKDTSGNSDIFLDNIIWWFEVDKYIEVLKPKIEKEYKNFKKFGTGLIYDYRYNPLIKVSLYRNDPISRYEKSTYYIRCSNNISGNEEVIYEKNVPFSIQDIINSIRKYFENNNYFDEDTIKKLYKIKDGYDLEIKEAEEKYNNLPTWIIDYRDSDGDVSHTWVKANTENAARNQFKSDYSNEILRVYKEK